MEEQNSQYEIEKSRTGVDVPVVNGVYLHSIYDPQKEAETFAEKYRENLKHKNNVLVLGLGYGYHIEAIAKILSEYHGDYSIIVLEPDAKIIESFEENKNFINDKSYTVELKCAKQLYDQLNFIEFLMQKPCVIKHEASFSIHNEIFTSVLKYKASKNINSYQELLTPAAKNLIQTTSHNDLSMFSKEIANQGNLKTKSDYATLALNAVINR